MTEPRPDETSAVRFCHWIAIVLIAFPVVTLIDLHLATAGEPSHDSDFSSSEAIHKYQSDKLAFVVIETEVKRFPFVDESETRLEYRVLTLKRESGGDRVFQPHETTC